MFEPIAFIPEMSLKKESECACGLYSGGGFGKCQCGLHTGDGDRAS